jgi:PAS domain S-box-containing protein
MTDYETLLGQVIASHASEIVLITNGDLDSPYGPTIVYVTEGIFRTSGYLPAELIGRRLGMLFEEGAMPQVLAGLQEAAQSRSPITVEQQGRHREGRRHWLELSTTPVFDNRGMLTHFVRMSRDITARKKAERHREMTQRLLASVFGVIKEPLAVADETGNLIMANNAVTRRLGWSIFDLMGKPVSCLISEADRPQLDTLMRDGEALDQTRQLRCFLLPKGKQNVQGEVELTSCRQPSGESYHILTLRERAEDEREWNMELAVREALNTGKGKGTGTVVAGKLQLVGLAAVRENLGDRWPAMADRAFSLAERTIQRHLRPGDISRRSKDDGFLVLFAHLSATEAQFKANAISAEIQERLTGEIPELAEASVASFAAKVEVEEGSLGSEESIVDAIDRRLREERERVERRSIEILTAGFKTGRPVIQSIVNEGGQPAPITIARLSGEMREAANVLRSTGRASYELEVETFLLAGAGERVLAGLSRNSAALVMAPVRFSTLSQARDLEAWLKVVRTLGDAAKQKMVVEVCEIPAGVAATRLADLNMRLAALFKSIAFEIPAADPAFHAKLPQSTRLTTIEYRMIPWGALGEPGQGFQKLSRSLDLRQRRLIVKEIPSPAKHAALAKVGISLFLPPLA